MSRLRQFDLQIHFVSQLVRSPSHSIIFCAKEKKRHARDAITQLYWLWYVYQRHTLTNILYSLHSVHVSSNIHDQSSSTIFSLCFRSFTQTKSAPTHRQQTKHIHTSFPLAIKSINPVQINRRAQSTKHHTSR